MEPAITHGAEPTAPPAQGNIALALRGREIFGLDIFRQTRNDTSPNRVQQLMATMNEDIPPGGADHSYGKHDSHRLRFWEANQPRAPLLVFVHGGSWRSGTYLDSIGSAKVAHFLSEGYAFASVDYTLNPTVTVEEQVQEVANAVGYLAGRGSDLGINPKRLVLMGHSSAHTSSLSSAPIRPTSPTQASISPAFAASSASTARTTMQQPSSWIVPVPWRKILSSR